MKIIGNRAKIVKIGLLVNRIYNFGPLYMAG